MNIITQTLIRAAFAKLEKDELAWLIVITIAFELYVSGRLDTLLR